MNKQRNNFSTIQQIYVIGAGYVGLVSACCFAELGFQVCCVEKQKEKLTLLNQGICPIYEPGLQAMLKKHLQSSRLWFRDNVSLQIDPECVVILAVGTPTKPGGDQADLSYLYQAIDDLLPCLCDGALIVTKSTVPVGTGKNIVDMIVARRPELEVDVASNPEFLREGKAVSDFMQPDRVVIGCENASAKHKLCQLYQPLADKGVPIISVNRATAELIKYASNAFLATKIMFINEMADLAEYCEADIFQVSAGMGADHRIGNDFLQAGPGYGGSCFPKDTRALTSIAATYGVNLPIVNAVMIANEKRKENMVDKVIDACAGSVSGKRIAIWGIAFKAGTDDFRDSVSLTVVPKLQAAGANIYAYDPAAMQKAQEIFTKIVWCDNALQAANNADVVVVLTEWEEFKTVNLTQLGEIVRRLVMVDLRNLFKPEKMSALGWQYYSIGRPAVQLEEA